MNEFVSSWMYVPLIATFLIIFIMVTLDKNILLRVKATLLLIVVLIWLLYYVLFGRIYE